MIAFGEGGGEGGPKMEHAAQQLLAVTADFVAAAEKAERHHPNPNPNPDVDPNPDPNPNPNPNPNPKPQTAPSP